MTSLPLYRRARRANPEAALQRAVAEHLRLTGTPGMLYFAIKNEGRRSEALGLEFKRQGMRPGAADLEIVVPGKPPLFLELKARGGRQSPEQVAFAADCVLAGCRYELADNIDDAMHILREYGALRTIFRRAELRADIAAFRGESA